MYATSASIWCALQFAPDRRHLPLAVPQQRLDPLAVAEQRVAAERRADVGVVEPVALLADAGPLLLAERRACPRSTARLAMNASYCAARHDVDRRLHQRVLDAAELGAARDVRAGRRLEPGLVHRARDRVVLAAEVRHPPRVDDVVVVADDVLVHDLVGRRDHAVDRDRAVRIAEEPVELVALDRDRRLVGRGGLRRVGDAGQLVEDERADHGEDHDRDDRPDDLEPRRAVDLRSLGGARRACRGGT